jgi:hypothetical protein
VAVFLCKNATPATTGVDDDDKDTDANGINISIKKIVK